VFRWAQAVLNVQATMTVMFIAAYGQRPPASMAFDPSAHPQTMVGVQFAPWATSESASTTAARPEASSVAQSSTASGQSHCAAHDAMQTARRARIHPLAASGIEERSQALMCLESRPLS